MVRIILTALILAGVTWPSNSVSGAIASLPELAVEDTIIPTAPGTNTTRNASTQSEV